MFRFNLFETTVNLAKNVFQYYILTKFTLDGIAVGLN